MNLDMSHVGSLYCPICNGELAVRLATGRKSGKPFVMLRCGSDGRHLRAFINHRPYVKEVLDQLENSQQLSQAGDR